MLEHSELIRNRYEKAKALRAKNINPYANRFIPTHTSQEILNNSEQLIATEQKVVIAGRILTIRSFGKAAFFHVMDGKGKIQAFVKSGMMPDEEFALFREFIDSGDIVGIEGVVFRTKTGEVTVLAQRLHLLTKSVRPLPEKWHGLRDTDVRYRQRYVDLIVNEDVYKTFEMRSKIMSACRRYLDGRGYMEVETPMMHPIYGGAFARPFLTYHNTLDIQLYLRIAPELYLKRLLVGGFEKVYEINRNFRNEGISVQHNPEFTMLELYTAFWDYMDTAALLEDMLKAIARDVLGTTKITYQDDEIDLSPPDGWKRMTILEAIQATLGLRLKWGESPDDIRAKIGQISGLNAAEFNDLGSVDLILKLFDQKVEPTLIQPTFIMGYPRAKSPLAKTRPDDPLVAERFELFVGRLEVANAYSELNDPAEQLQRFQEQAKRRAAGDAEAMCVDEDYVRALEYGMPPASGLGVGMDRLVMLFTDCSSIRDVILFPTLRPEGGRPAKTENEKP